MISKISLQACWLRSCFHQLTNLVLAEWCPHVPDVAARSLPIIYGLVKRAVSAIHFFWMVSLEFLVIENWTTFVVCCLRVGLNARVSPLPRRVLDPLSDFQIRNSLPVPLSVWRTISPHFSFLLSSRAQNRKCSANNHQNRFFKNQLFLFREKNFPGLKEFSVFENVQFGVLVVYISLQAYLKWL